MTDMTKPQPEQVAKKETAKNVIETEFEIKLPGMSTPVGMVFVGAILAFFSSGRNSLPELYVGGGLVALGGLLEFIDRRRKLPKINR